MWLSMVRSEHWRHLKLTLHVWHVEGWHVESWHMESWHVEAWLGEDASHLWLGRVSVMVFQNEVFGDWFLAIDGLRDVSSSDAVDVGHAH